MTASVSVSSQILSCQRYIDRTGGMRFTHAARCSSTSARAISSAFSGLGNVDSTRIGVIVGAVPCAAGSVGSGAVLIVQKYGGTSVGSIERMKNVAARCVATQRQGHQVAV